jgi:crotonobetainyl-CoA:carnitine CoA-transferase CaiB-like acyl-CoA transferase
MTTSFAWGNRNKLGLGLNLRDPAGVAVFRRLTETADLVLSNFKPGTLESLGIGYDQLRAVNPAIVVASSSAVGHTGPWRSWMGYGPLVRAAAGLTSLWRESLGSEVFSDSVTVYPDHYAARVVAIAALAGIVRARRTGIGVRIDSAQAEAILTALSHRFAQEGLHPGSFRPEGNRGSSDAPWAVLPCAGDDEWCVVTVRDDEDWACLCQAIGAPELVTDRRFSTTERRLAHAAEAEAALAKWTGQRTPDEVTSLLQAAGVPAGPMRRPAELAADPHLAARRYWATLYQPGVGDPLPVEARPFVSDCLPDPEQRPAPFHGEHTTSICARLLGLNPSEIAVLLTAGALEATDPWQRLRN